MKCENYCLRNCAWLFAKLANEEVNGTEPSLSVVFVGFACFGSLCVLARKKDQSSFMMYHPRSQGKQSQGTLLKLKAQYH